MLEDVWMKEQNCVISVLCGDKKEKRKKKKKEQDLLLYLFYLVPFD